ncbi:MAG: hypothetical protein A2821_00020 [Candidatus Magasanikbacteria bacterium RIFCSPHIGHO2_01_FULL_41_23]|uniref:Phosphatidylglycerol--prolipoprotein diacylglyceryl transferase n=1 Tax=Candidatus Magasanikbacteria bacterium RIFCSPLOWO2_01_FULL_40_15 TaxID=1798686 RepID=A0A1F6N3M6_9BACT|nr:MAG: hypothetical protein A2821_00020 [Candidatus Magasanikbacteria bacterium RIFCSPHIGHO2_01_FULL_41_23]OGH76617.1 MAG: hypothetical protein A3F22_04750 [Candidatus Magasanikbacteria bacterium RIFCSPHIGHO2_12_FULL_41_16]OGH78595.1 MAG: hypothetical protein A2983_02950 [Candidatus Magasanikbacteria bacterium RIFCSPLOWO2_01_FULL_40_15]
MIPWFQFTVVYFGPIPIQVWGFFVALGMGVSLWMIGTYTKNNPKQKNILDIAFWTIIWGFIGARLGHVLLYEPLFFWQNPIEIFKIWQGGMSSFGSFLGAGLAAWYLIKKNKFNLKELGDLFLVAAVPGWMIGRVGCFMIHDHLGVHSNCPLAIMTPTGPRLDMAWLEILGMMPLALGLWITRRKILQSGTRALIILAYYSALRLVLDFWRATDIANADTRYYGLTPAQYFSIVLLVFCSFWLVKIKRK